MQLKSIYSILLYRDIPLKQALQKGELWSPYHVCLHEKGRRNNRKFQRPFFVYGYHVNTEIYICTEFHIHVCYSLQVGKSLDLHTSKGKVHVHFHEYHRQEMASGL